jgi:hypothetical protein
MAGSAGACAGQRVVEPPTGRAVVTVDRTMVRSGQTGAAHDGTIDRQGPPW